MLIEKTIEGFGVWIDLFLLIWAGLDAIFSWIDLQFKNIFSGIPGSAIPFVMGICLISVIEFWVFFTNRTDTGRKRVMMKILYVFMSILLILVTIWRLGIVAIVDANEDIGVTITEFIIFLAYFVFIVALIYSYYKQNKQKIRKGILLICWVLFLLITYILAPIFEGFVLSDSTLAQTIYTVFLFVTPHALTKYQEYKKKGV